MSNIDEEDKFIEKIMDKIQVSEDLDEYGSWKVSYKEKGEYITIDRYNVDSLIDSFDMDDEPADFEIENAILNSFEDRLRRLYDKHGEAGVLRALREME